MKSEKKHRVIVFSTPSCPWCRRTKQYLRQNRILFKDVDISRNSHAAADMVRRTRQSGVPVVLIDNRPVVGFNKAMIDRLLGIK